MTDIVMVPDLISPAQATSNLSLSGNLNASAFPVKEVWTGSKAFTLSATGANAAGTTAINDMAQAIGRHTIAGYVTNAETLKSLKACGVDYAQGFYIAEPMSKEDLFIIHEDEPTIVSVHYEVEMR